MGIPDVKIIRESYGQEKEKEIMRNKKYMYRLNIRKKIQWHCCIKHNIKHEYKTFFYSFRNLGYSVMNSTHVVHLNNKFKICLALSVLLEREGVLVILHLYTDTMDLKTSDRTSNYFIIH